MSVSSRKTTLVRLGLASVLALASWMVVAPVASAQPPGEGPALGDRLTQEEVESGDLSLTELRREGRRVFSTPFNKLDGYGDGPMNKNDPTSPGGRPSLQDNGTFLRVNGLDGQTCLECHSIVSNATIPATFGVGGIGAASANAIFQPTDIDVDDEVGVGYASFNGRFINPPFLFGSGGIELLGKEMTEDLQALLAEAKANPGQDVELLTKGVDFGTIRFQDGKLVTDGIEGVDEDLVVRPFGRKGEFPTVRAFDLEALAFHFGMQPSEVVGKGIDDDGDGVLDEVTAGEISAMHIFNTTLERPRKTQVTEEVQAGFKLFQSIGCAECHTPILETRRKELSYCFPEIPERPFENEFYRVDLSEDPTGFKETKDGGLSVILFADLKRHDMGDALAESFGSELDRFFTTARLWGVADTAPYLHDGRATTLTEAILLHGGEAQAARDNFAGLSDKDRILVLTMLRALRTPSEVGTGLDE